MSLGGNALGDGLGIHVGMRGGTLDPGSDPLDIDTVTWGGTVEADDATLRRIPSIIWDNPDVTDITSDSALAHATLTMEGAPNAVAWLYWDTSDRGETHTAWSNTNALGTVAEGQVESTIGNLEAGTAYWYRFFGTNSTIQEHGWSPAAGFTTVGVPFVDNGAGATVAASSATLRGNLTDGIRADISIYWGPTDGGTNQGAWANVEELSTQPEGDFSVDVTVYAGFTNYYRCYASNAVGDAWSPSSTTFTLQAAVHPGILFMQDDGTDGLVSMEAENFAHNESPRSNHSWLLQTEPSASGGKAMGALPAAQAPVSITANYEPDSPRLDFRVRFVKTGTHIIWVRGRATESDTGVSDSCHAGLDTNMVATADKITGYGTGYQWSRDTMDGVNDAAFNVPTTGEHAFNVWMREDGFFCDKIVLTTSDTYAPTGNGPPESDGVSVPIVPAITNDSESAVTTDSAVLNGTLNGSGWVFDVYAFWGTSDGGSVAGDWDASAYAGRYTNYEGAVSCMVTGLVRDLDYRYTFMATNLLTNTWASPSEPFTAQSMLTVSNSLPMNVTVASATVGGELVAGGGGEAVIYWGRTDGQAIADDWANTTRVGAAVAGGTFSTSMTVKAAGTYYYRCYATNAVGDDWADSSVMFATPLSSVSIDDVLLPEGDSGTADAHFTVTLAHESATNVSVRFASADGTAVAGADYAATNGTLVIPAGQTNGAIVVRVRGDVEFEYPSEAFLVTLSNPINCTIADAQAVCTISDDDNDASAYLAGFSRRMEITFDGYAGGGTLTDWPALVRLGTNVTGFSYGDFASASGGDLRFSSDDASRMLDFEIEAWDAEGESCVWVKVPELSGTGTAIWAYWGNPADTDLPLYATNGAMWSASYAGVWHMTEPNARDASGHGNNGTANNNTDAVGMISGAQGFTGNDDCYLDIRQNYRLPIYNNGTDNRVTLMMWLKGPAGQNDQRFFCEGSTADNRPLYAWGTGKGDRTRAHAYIRTDTNRVLRDTDGGVTIFDDTWHHVAWVDDAGDVAFFVDGQEDAAASTALDYTRDTITLNTTSFGAIRRAAISHAWQGSIDEARIVHTARSADWIRASYSNQVAGSTFNTYGDVFGTGGLLIIVR